MQAVGHRILEQPGKVVAYISTEALLNEYVNSIQIRVVNYNLFLFNIVNDLIFVFDFNSN